MNNRRSIICNFNEQSWQSDILALDSFIDGHARINNHNNDIVFFLVEDAVFIGRDVLGHPGLLEEFQLFDYQITNSEKIDLDIPVSKKNIVDILSKAKCVVRYMQVQSGGLCSLDIIA